VSRILLAAGILITLGACGAPMHWRNADASRSTAADFRWDSYHCGLESRYVNAHPHWGANPLFPYMVVDEERVAQCLKDRGWREEITPLHPR
jgi:hypothetical protein